MEVSHLATIVATLGIRFSLHNHCSTGEFL